MENKALFEQIEEAIAFIKSKTSLKPKFGIILGTGLGNLVNTIEISCRIPYGEIPHFPVSTVQSHKGELIFGSLNGAPIVAMAGRFHYYEGYTMQQVTLPVRVMKFLGIERLMISNVSGSTNPKFEAGDICIIKDHINMQPANPLRGTNDERIGPRFPDMLHTYDREMRAIAVDIATKEHFRFHEAVYVALAGPNLETPAEYNFINIIGGDLIGMSTVPEVIVARHMDLAVFVISIVSNKCFPIEELTETTVEEVIQIAAIAEPKMTKVITEMIGQLSEAKPDTVMKN